jgi:hypothetical protein
MFRKRGYMPGDRTITTACAACLVSGNRCGGLLADIGLVQALGAARRQPFIQFGG